MFKKYFLLILLPFLFFTDFTQAHPMDAARLQIDVDGYRAIFNLKIHQLAVEKLLNTTLDLQKIPEFKDGIFKATLGQATPLLNNEVCEWRKPEVSVTEENEKNAYINLQVVVVCALARLDTEAIVMELPFLKSMPSVFKMMTTIKGLSADKSEALNLILSAQEFKISVNAEAYKNQNVFIKLGMAHIGADKGEWLSATEGLHWPEGLDHILFVLALVLISSSLISTIKNATGFTIGHTLTLILATYKIVHVHSHWVEALIALSIAVVIGLSYFKKYNKHGLLVNSILGTLHGLGFASVIHDLQLPQEMVLPTLFSFNIGVELGQILIILVAYSALSILKMVSQKSSFYFIQAFKIVIFFISLFWFIQRGLG